MCDSHSYEASERSSSESSDGDLFQPPVPNKYDSKKNRRQMQRREERRQAAKMHIEAEGGEEKPQGEKETQRRLKTVLLTRHR